MSFVSKAVKSVTGWVGSAVTSVVDFAVDDIIKPVVNAVGGVIQGMKEDPLTAIAYIAAMVIPGMQWAIPIIAGISTAMKGGDIKDIAVSVAASYAGMYVGGAAGQYANAYVGQATGSQIAGQIAGAAASGATRGAIRAAATGNYDSILDQAFSGAVSGAVVAGADAVWAELDIGGLASSGGETVDLSGTSIPGGFDDAAEAIGFELSDIVDGFSELPTVVQDMIKGAATASITSLLTEGEVNPDAVAGAIGRAAITSNAVINQIPDFENMSAGQQAVITGVLGDVVNSAYAGTDAYAAYEGAILKVGEAALQSEIDDLTSGGLDALIDNMSGNTNKFTESFAETQELLLARNTAASGAEALANSLNEKVLANKANIDSYNRWYKGELLGEYTPEQKAALGAALSAAPGPGHWVQTSRGSQKFIPDDGPKITHTALVEQFQQEHLDSLLLGYPDGAAMRAAISEFENVEYPDLRAQYDAALGEFSTLEGIFRASAVETQEYRELMLTDEKYLDQTLMPLRQVATKSIVETLTLDPQTGATRFNADEYRETYGLTEDDDPYSHWIQTGRTNPVNQVEYDAQLEYAVFNQVQEVALANATNPDFDIAAATEAAKEAIGFDLTKAMTAEGRSQIEASTAAYVGEIAGDPGAETAITLGEGVTAEDIANGTATLHRSFESGQPPTLQWQKGIKQDILGPEIFMPDVNRVVQVVYKRGLHFEDDGAGGQTAGQVVYIDPKTGEQLAAFTDAIINDEGVAEYSEGRTFSAISMPPPNWMTLATLVDVAPLVAIDSANKIVVNEEAYANLSSEMQFVLDYAIKTKRAAESTGNYAVRLAAGTALSAGGELAQSFNGVLTFLDQNPADNSQAGQVSQAIVAIATATLPAEYNEAIAKFQQDVGAATGFGETVEAIWNGFLEAPLEVAVEYVGKELLQEIPLLLASGGVGTLVRGGARAAAYASKLTRKLGGAAAYTSNAGLQVIETAGGTARETYNELYEELIAAGVNENVAMLKAQEGAILTGATAALVEGVAGRFFDPGDVIAGKIGGAGDAVFGRALDGLARKGLAVGGEGLSEGAEEVIAQHMKIEMLAEINPDIVKPGGRYEDYAGSLTASGVLGAVSGIGTAGALVFGDTVYEASKTQYDAGVDSGDIDPDVTPPPTPPPDNPGGGGTGNLAANALIAFNPYINEAANQARSADPEVQQQGETTLREAFAYDSYFDDNGEIIDLSQDEAGVVSYNTAVDVLNTANDAGYTSYQEALGAYEAVADQSPYELTDADILAQTGDTPDADLDDRLRKAANDSYIDQLFQAEGYTPTEADLQNVQDQAQGQYIDAETGAGIMQGYDPLAVTQKEVEDYYANLGFSGPLSTTDIDALTGVYSEAELAERADERLPMLTYNSIAEMLGKPAQQLTDTDIDFVADLIAQQEAMTEPMTYTDQQLQYDITGDNVIDVADQNVLQALQTQQQTGQQLDTATQEQLDQQNQFVSSGIAGQIQTAQAAQGRQRMAQEQQRRQTQQQQQLQSIMSPGASGQVETPDAAEIGYVYDFSSIFANPEQEKLFTGPYGQTGRAEDPNDKFLREIGGV